MRTVSFFGSFLLLIFLISACNFPKDPNNTFQKAQKSTLKIGVVLKSNDSNVQYEQQLVKEFGAQYNLQPSFTVGSETELIKQLENYQLDIVLGGFEKESIWKKKVGMTKPYDSKHVFFIPKGENYLLFKLEEFFYKNQNP